MEVQTAKAFTHGFLLTESDLQQITDAVINRFAEQFDGSHPRLSFAIKLKSGVTIQAYSIDRVLSQENVADSQIVRLKMVGHPSEATDPTTVSLEFINADFEKEKGFTSIRLFVRGTSRDWVRATSSVLEERILQIRRFAPSQLGKTAMNRLSVMLIGPLILLSFFLGIIYPVEKLTRDGFWVKYSWLINYTEITSQELTSSEYLYAWQENESKSTISNLIASRAFKRTIFFVIVLEFIILFFIRYYPFYNFCWSNYFRFFHRDENTRSSVFLVTLSAIFISFVHSILTSLTGKHT